MSDFTIRRITLQIEEVHHEGGPRADAPHLKGAIMAVCSNPFAGRYVEDLQPAMETLKPLALMLTDRLVAALGGRDGIDAYGTARPNTVPSGTFRAATGCAKGWANAAP